MALARASDMRNGYLYFQPISYTELSGNKVERSCNTNKERNYAKVRKLALMNIARVLRTKLLFKCQLQLILVLKVMFKTKYVHTSLQATKIG